MNDRELYEEGLLMDLEKAKARIEELIKERDQAWKRADHAEEMWGRAEAKLSETTYALKRIASNEFAGVMLTSMPPQDAAAHFARLTLAKLTGGKDE